MLFQFICKISEIPQESVHPIENCQSSTNNKAGLSEALHCILTHLDSAHVMKYGLDEWPLENSRRSSLMGWIATLDGRSFPHLHVLLTGQHLPDIKETLSDKCAIAHRFSYGHTNPRQIWTWYGSGASDVWLFPENRDWGIFTDRQWWRVS